MLSSKSEAFASDLLENMKKCVFVIGSSYVTVSSSHEQVTALLFSTITTIFHKSGPSFQPISLKSAPES